MAGHGPLKMHCPFCETYAGHSVKATAAQPYILGEEWVAFFTGIVGRDLYMRVRIRKCATCQRTFPTGELEMPFLTALLQHTAQLEHENASLKSSYVKLEERVDTQPSCCHALSAVYGDRKVKNRGTQ